MARIANPKRGIDTIRATSDGQNVPNTPAPIDAPLLLGRYRPLRLLGRGGSSQVWQGIDETLGRDVAIKLFSASSHADDYRSELRLLASLSHHGIVSIVDAGLDESAADDPRPFLVMELLRGKTIREAMMARVLSPREVGEIGFEIAEALDYVHSRGVIHRDVTPSNVILTEYGTASSRPRARLTDFGIAIGIASQSTGGNLIKGTAGYVSPEQVRSEPLTPASDIYSLGLVMLECFTQERAYPGEPVAAALARLQSQPTIPKSVPKQWRELITQMVKSEPFDRPTAAEVAGQIRHILRK